MIMRITPLFLKLGEAKNRLSCVPRKCANTVIIALIGAIKNINNQGLATSCRTVFFGTFS